MNLFKAFLSWTLSIHTVASAFLGFGHISLPLNVSYIIHLIQSDIYFCSIQGSLTQYRYSAISHVKLIIFASVQEIINNSFHGIQLLKDLVYDAVVYPECWGSPQRKLLKFVLTTRRIESVVFCTFHIWSELSEYLAYTQTTPTPMYWNPRCGCLLFQMIYFHVAPLTSIGFH